MNAGKCRPEKCRIQTLLRCVEDFWSASCDNGAALATGVTKNVSNSLNFRLSLYISD